MCKDYNKSKIFPNNQFVYELLAANEGHVSHWNHELHYAVTLCYSVDLADSKCYTLHAMLSGMLKQFRL